MKADNIACLSSTALAIMLAITGCELSEQSPTEYVMVDLANVEVQVEDEKTPLALGASELADVRFYVVEREAAETGVIRGFRSEAAYEEYLDGVRAAESDISTEECNPKSYFFAHQGFAGDHLEFSQPNTQIGHLGDYGFNDRISSLLTTQCGGLTTLFEHKFYGGSIVTFQSSLGIESLGDVSCGLFCSWNDRASSLTVSF